jgi:hypothetical protein
MLHDSFEYAADDFRERTHNPERGLTGDYFLSKALAFLLHARETPPFKTQSPYRTPDHPYSLFEGLAGTVCAWAEACVAITIRLRKIEAEEERGVDTFKDDEEFESLLVDELGFPGLGGHGAKGLL